ncbi:MAG: endonuclease III [Phycisphaerae bacterium]|nr:endonuclease III [Phycisphaerae bacterium]
MPRETNADRKARARKIIGLLRRMYPDAHCSLDYSTPLQLLVATVLSAQCTDKRVNLVTPALFAKYPDAKALADANLDELMNDVRSTGFYRNKAKAIQSACRDIVARHAGRVPDTMEALTELSGVGRKTANVVLGNAFNVAVGVVVDTHVGRVARRLGLTGNDDPVKAEADLMGLFEKGDWIYLSHALILHGRNVCASQRPNCAGCGLAQLCPSAFTFQKR